MSTPSSDEEKLLFRMRQLIPRGLSASGSVPSKSSEVTFEELSFPFEWGTIAAKAWGPRDGKPVLAIHGWLDNCGTFDTLIPLLPRDLRIVAVDMPGHGLSSHYPLGISYQFMECLPRIRQLCTLLEWDRFSILGHSLGGAMAVFYSGIFPETVEKIIVLDIFRPPATIPEMIHLRLRKSAEVILKSEVEMGLPEKTLPYEKAIAFAVKASAGSLDQKAAEILFKRGLKQVETGFTFRRDRRLRAAPLTFTPAQDQLEIAKNTTCDVLIIIADQGPWFESEEVLQQQLEAFRTKSKRVEYHVVEGKHHVHLTNPERIAPIINNFFAN